MNNNGNPDGVPVEVWGVSIKGPPDDNEAQVDQKTYPFIDDVGISYPILMDYYHEAYDQLQPSGYEIPHLCIINGVPNDLKYEPWEILYSEVGYRGSQIIKSLREIIDEVAPSDFIKLKISTNWKFPVPGDDLSAFMNTRYYGELDTIDVYCALMVLGELFFYPTWTNSPEATKINVNKSYDETITLFSGLPITKNIPQGTYSILGIAAEHEKLLPICELAKRDFTVIHAPIREMETYFEENPTYYEIGHSSYFNIYLNNRGNIDLTIKSFSIELFDKKGKEIGSQDLTESFSEWFELTESVLPAGVTAMANISISMSEPVKKGAIFYFTEKDEKEYEVSIQSEKLIMIPRN